MLIFGVWLNPKLVKLTDEPANQDWVGELERVTNSELVYTNVRSNME